MAARDVERDQRRRARRRPPRGPGPCRSLLQPLPAGAESRVSSSRRGLAALASRRATRKVAQGRARVRGLDLVAGEDAAAAAAPPPPPRRSAASTVASQVSRMRLPAACGAVHLAAAASGAAVGEDFFFVGIALSFVTSSCSCRSLVLRRWSGAPGCRAGAAAAASSVFERRQPLLQRLQGRGDALALVRPPAAAAAAACTPAWASATRRWTEPAISWRRASASSRVRRPRVTRPGHDALRLAAGARGGLLRDRATPRSRPPGRQPRRMSRLSTWWGMVAVRCRIPSSTTWARTTVVMSSPVRLVHHLHVRPRRPPGAPARRGSRSAAPARRRACGCRSAGWSARRRGRSGSLHGRNITHCVIECQAIE